MTGLNKEQFDAMVDEWDKHLAKEEQMLIKRGWHKKISNSHQHKGKEVWVEPKKGMVEEEHVSIHEAINVCYMDWIHEFGFRLIDMLIITSLETETMGAELWQHFIHPKSGRIYCYLEVIDMLLYYDGDDSGFFPNYCCGRTMQLNELYPSFDGIKTIRVFFGPKTDTGENVFKRLT